MVNDCLDQIRSTLYLLFNLVIDLAEEHREWPENSWLQFPDVLDKIFDVSRRISNPEPKHDGIDVDDLLVNVG